MFSKEVEKILPKVQKPGRYVGGELNSIIKDKNKEKSINEFEKQIIKSNIFYRNCDRLFIRRNDSYDNLSLQDENIVNKIKNNESILDLKFKDVKSALEYIDMTDFKPHYEVLGFKI